VSRCGRPIAVLRVREAISGSEGVRGDHSRAIKVGKVNLNIQVVELGRPVVLEEELVVKGRIVVASTDPVPTAILQGVGGDSSQGNCDVILEFLLNSVWLGEACLTQLIIDRELKGRVN
jgi:hypothetical protein